MESIKFEYRASLKFSLKDRKPPTFGHRVRTDSAPNYCTVTRWFKEFTRGYHCRAVSLEISGNLLITYVNQLFPSPMLQSDAVK